MISAPAPFRHVEKNVSILPEGPPHAATPPNPCDVLPFSPPTTLCWTPQPSGIMSCLCPIPKLMACCSWHLIQMIFFLSLSTQLNSTHRRPHWRHHICLGFEEREKKRIPTLAVCPSGDFSFFRPRATWCDNSGTSAALPDLALRMFQTHEYSGGIRAFCVPPLLHQTTSPCERFKTIKTRN